MPDMRRPSRAVPPGQTQTARSTPELSDLGSGTTIAPDRLYSIDQPETFTSEPLDNEDQPLVLWGDVYVDCGSEPCSRWM